MSQRKLTKRQQVRIKKFQEQKNSRKIQNEKTSDENIQCINEVIYSGRVLQNFGKRLLIQVKNQNSEELVNCSFRQNLGQIVAGDVVFWQKIISKVTNKQNNFQGIVVSVSERKSLLSRPVFQGKHKAIAANVNQAFIIAAPDVISKNIIDKMVNMRLIDRYLVICENSSINPIIIINKIDLLDDKLLDELDKSLSIYSKLNYEIIFTSVLNGTGVLSLKNKMADNNSIFVGQSGMGKTSLINSIIPNVNAKIAGVSEASGKGKHTTTSARLYDLNEAGIHDGFIIDSPGIRELGLWKIDKNQVQIGFKEIMETSYQCQFRDCTHTHEPGCAVLAAIENKEISKSRLISFHHILDTLN
ncbi:MAG: ribosome small subunit-dependent GTPase A [Gammaproteobacteria bacterium]|nr:ribosome small subunit-dependent GTPase A [Gammaproteobacteria bacterium]